MKPYSEETYMKPYSEETDMKPYREESCLFPPPTNPIRMTKGTVEQNLMLCLNSLTRGGDPAPAGEAKKYLQKWLG